MTDIADIYPKIRLDYHLQLNVPLSIPMGNISLCEVGDKYLLSIRQFNYTLVNGCYSWSAGFYEKRNNYFALVDRNFNFIKRVRCRFIGLELMEDIRLVNFGDVIQASFTDPYHWGHGLPRIGTAFLSFDSKMDELYVEKSFRFGFERNKNWIPTTEKGKFICDILDGCILIVSLDAPDKKQKMICGGAVPWRGSSQLYPYKSGYVALVHRRSGNKFTNSFAFFRDDFSRVAFSREFTVMRKVSSVNFCCGMVIRDGFFTLPFCINDIESHVFRLPVEDFEV